MKLKVACPLLPKNELASSHYGYSGVFPKLAQNVKFAILKLNELLILTAFSI